MSNRTITRSDLTNAIHEAIGLSRNDSAYFVEAVLEQIAVSLQAGEQVKLSSFGTFSVRDKAMRMGRNPKTGEEVPIEPRRVVVFRPSQILKKRVNRAARPEERTAAAQ